MFPFRVNCSQKSHENNVKINSTMSRVCVCVRLSFRSVGSRSAERGRKIMGMALVSTKTARESRRISSGLGQQATMTRVLRCPCTKDSLSTDLLLVYLLVYLSSPSPFTSHLSRRVFLSFFFDLRGTLCHLVARATSRHCQRPAIVVGQSFLAKIFSLSREYFTVSIFLLTLTWFVITERHSSWMTNARVCSINCLTFRE